MKKEPNKHSCAPKHSLGQNFITDESLLKSLVLLSGVGKEDSVFEIGPGNGGMTAELALACRQVTALEIDGDLIPYLKAALIRFDNVKIEKGDVMRVNLNELTKPLGPFHVVANLPYYLTTPLLNMLVSSNLPILSMNVMLQLEAAQKICSVPGDEGYGPLAIRIQWYYAPLIALTVPAQMFTPPPKVDSAFVTMKKRTEPLCRVEDEKMFLQVVAAAFSMRRKTLLNNLMNSFRLPRETASEILTQSGLSQTCRAEEVSIARFACLSDHILEKCE